MVVYPDDFSFADAGVGAMPFGAYAVKQIDADEWEALEDAGCMFLPSCRARGYTGEGGDLQINEDIGNQAWYWSATGYNAQNAYNIQWVNSSRIVYTNQGRYQSYSVRLVQDYY